MDILCYYNNFLKIFIGALIQRHSGVLGLAALVEACPYSVPEWLPEILDEMALHLHDPAPIQVRFFCPEILKLI